MSTPNTTVRVNVAVNGAPTEHDVEARTLLVQYLREVVGLTGTNIGCDSTPGMVMAAVSLAQEGGALGEADVRKGLEGNLCRCTGYHNIVAAVLAGSADMAGNR